MMLMDKRLALLFYNDSNYTYFYYFLYIDSKSQLSLMSTKKDKPSKSTREQSQQKLKAQKQAYLKQMKEYKTKMKPLVKFLRKNKLRFQHALVGTQRVEYFRLDQYEKIIEQHKQKIEKNIELDKLVKNANSQFVFFKRPQSIKVKYPKSLQPVLSSSVDKKYASFRFDTTESKKWMVISIICLILAIVLFPVWPFEVKYALWWISLILLVFLVGIIIIRLIIYLIIVIIDYHVWIFPNLLNSPGILESFIPIIQVSKGDKSWFNVFLRLFGISFFLLVSLHIYLNPNFIEDNIKFTKDTIVDVHDWGVSKLKNEGNFSQKALTNLQKILNETADVENATISQNTQTLNSNEPYQQEVNADHELGQQQNRSEL